MESLRMCCVCREMKPKEKLIRVVKTKDGQIFVDNTKKADGRGAYVCCEDQCLEKIKKVKGLNRAFKGQVSEEIYDELLKKKEF